MALWENHESHHLCIPSLKQKNGHLRSACGKIRWLVRAILGLTSDEEGNGPVRTITRGRDESALLQGGCLEGGEAEEPGGWPCAGSREDRRPFPSSIPERSVEFKPKAETWIFQLVLSR